ncbi:hypothetical protein B0O99DRAFT_690701 [Bisporella sp. PMI_857]|nr:hypothetical protein B0O99DRAFT_690701 [Bisporella sp. PMI_857]
MPPHWLFLGEGISGSRVAAIEHHAKAIEFFKSSHVEQPIQDLADQCRHTYKEICHLLVQLHPTAVAIILNDAIGDDMERPIPLATINEAEIPIEFRSQPARIQPPRAAVQPAIQWNAPAAPAVAAESPARSPRSGGNRYDGRHAWDPAIEKPCIRQHGVIKPLADFDLRPKSGTLYASCRACIKLRRQARN